MQGMFGALPQAQVAYLASSMKCLLNKNSTCLVNEVPFEQEQHLIVYRDFTF